MSAAKYPELFPIALGNEEDSMLMTGPDMARMGDPKAFVGAFVGYMPKDIATVGEHLNMRTLYLQNGAKVYDGGAVNELKKGTLQAVYKVNLERTTPECATPKQVATYTEASERLYVDMLGNFVQNWAEQGFTRVARAQRRVIASNMQTRASHDNIEIRRPEWLETIQKDSQLREPATVAALHRYLASRSFITGAGYVNGDGSFFAQKVFKIDELEGYGTKSTAYRVASSDTGPRWEVRCNDINISPWAIQARIGGSALYATLLQTEAGKAITSLMPYGSTDRTTLSMYRRFNNAGFDSDGNLMVTKSVNEAVDFQDKVWELFDEQLGHFVELPDEYKTLINEVRYYIEDFRKVANGTESIYTLADRSDMAAKFAVLIDRWLKNPYKGDGKPLTDIESQAADLKYDVITVEPTVTGRSRATYGFGMRLRDNGQFRMSVKQSDVDRAYYQPPQATRAKLRGDMIRKGEVSTADWLGVRLKGTNEYKGLGAVILGANDSAA